MTWQPASRSRVQIVDSNIPDYRGCAQVPSRRVALRARHEYGTPRGSEESRRLLGTRFRLAYTDELSNTMSPQGMLASPCRLHHGAPITCLVTFIVAPQIHSILESDAMASIVHVLPAPVSFVSHTVASGFRLYLPYRLLNTFSSFKEVRAEPRICCSPVSLWLSSTRSLQSHFPRNTRLDFRCIRDTSSRLHGTDLQV